MPVRTPARARHPGFQQMEPLAYAVCTADVAVVWRVWLLCAVLSRPLRLGATLTCHLSCPQSKAPLDTETTSV